MVAMKKNINTKTIHIDPTLHEAASVKAFNSKPRVSLREFVEEAIGKAVNKK